MGRNTPKDSNPTPKVDVCVNHTLKDDKYADSDLSRDAVNVSDEISLDDYEERASVGHETVPEMSSVENEMKVEESRINKEETEIRKTAQALFALEEALLDQHISNIKVSKNKSFAFLLFYSLISRYRQSLKRTTGKCRNVKARGWPTSNHRTSRQPNG